MNCEPDRVSEHPHRPRLMRSLDRPLDEPLTELHRCIVYEIPPDSVRAPKPTHLGHGDEKSGPLLPPAHATCPRSIGVPFGRS